MNVTSVLRADPLNGLGSVVLKRPYDSTSLLDANEQRAFTEMVNQHHRQEAYITSH